MANPKTNPFLTKWGFILLQVVIVLLAIAVGAFGYRFIDKQHGELALLRRAQDILVENTIYEVPSDQELQHGMIRGMFDTIGDPFTYFVPPADTEIQSDQLQGEFGGVGARLERDRQNRWRLYPLPDSPALEAGLRDADILVSVDGDDITPETDEATLIALLHGPVGEKVDLTIQREGKEHTFNLRRVKIDLPSVAANLLPEDPRIGWVQVLRIAESTPEEIEESIQTLQDQGAIGLILDLRDNGGGLVDAGVEIARLFLEKGEVARQQFRDEDVEIFEVKTPGPFTDIPLVVLINGNTASAAEIVTGALATQNRVVLIGLPTYGKTTAQYIFDLQDGSSIHVTSGRWWIPGVAFPLQPDYPLAQGAAESEFIQKAMDALADQLRQ